LSWRWYYRFNILNNNIYLSDENPGYTVNDLSEIARKIKEKFPNSNIYIDNNPNFDTTFNDNLKQIAKVSRLRKIAEDSCNVEPNGVTWNDNLWDTYDNSLIQTQKSNINREWLFEQSIDNQEWNLQQN
jgi:hypothetical protein